MVSAHQGVRYNQPQASDLFGRPVKRREEVERIRMLLFTFGTNVRLVGFVYPTGFGFAVGGTEETRVLQ